MERKIIYFEEMQALLGNPGNCETGPGLDYRRHGPQSPRFFSGALDSAEGYRGFLSLE